MTFEDLRRILIECAGLAYGVDFAEDILDTDFAELGYDSLALMEAAARIKQEFGVDIPDDQIAALKTPRAMLDTVNEATGVTA